MLAATEREDLAPTTVPIQSLGWLGSVPDHRIAIHCHDMCKLVVSKLPYVLVAFSV